jgi:tripartite-type tricarboxylate transporter receptor subunit TctC
MRVICWISLLVLLVGIEPVRAQEYPEKGRTIRIVVSYPPGAANDILARIVSQKLQERWAVPVIVDNRSGANGMIGAETVAKAKPDGYTLWLGTDGPAAINKLLYRSMPYDPINDFTPLTMLARYQFVLVVSPSTGVTSVSELIALAKQKPGQIRYGSPGVGSQHHLGMELLAATAGIQMLHVPYRGSAAAINGLLTGDVQAELQGTAVVQPYLAANAIKALAVSSAVRSPVIPGLPTMSEAGVSSYDISAWFGMFAPANTPEGIVAKLNHELVEIVGLSDVREKMLAQGLEPATDAPDEFSAFLKSEVSRWAAIVSAAKLKPMD